MSVATLATLSKMDEGTAASNIVNIGSMFGLVKEQYGELADTLVRVDDAAATNIPKLVYGLQQAGFSAKALGENAKSTTIALAMLSPLGEMAGTSLNRMLENTTGKTPRARKAMLELGLATMKAGKFDNKFYDHGKFIGIAKALDLIKTKLAAVKGDGQRLLLAEKVFGEEGGRAALAALLAGKSYEQILKAMEDSYSATQKLGILMGGLNAQSDRFKNSWSSLAAEVLEPLNGTITEMLSGISDMTLKLQKFAGQSETTKNIVSGGAAVIGTGVAAYALTKFGKGALGGIKGLASSAAGVTAGIAEGKAVEAATGVTPVFVTNFAQLNSGSASNTATDLAATAAAASATPSLLKTVATGAKWIAYSTLPEIASLGAGAMAAAGAMVAAAGLIGYGGGTLINKAGFEGSDSQNTLGGVLAQIMANFGNREAEQALEINLHLDGQQISTVVETRQKNTARRN
jgi:TP901 family phage tail tape measure protein